MYPVYQSSMDSYPHQMNQVPHHHQMFGPVPGQLKADFDKCPLCYQSWPSGGNHGYPYPAQCHGCCDHNYSSGYSVLRPPPANSTPPYYHGNYPVAGPVPQGAYPVHYVPPNYTVEAPRYGYHSSEVPRQNHCCGCPNDTCHSMPRKNVKIEEDPVSEKKASGALLPFNLKSYPYPIVWIPPNYVMNEANKMNVSQHESGGTRDHELSKPSQQQQKLLNGWFPFDIEKSDLVKQANDSTEKQQHQYENERQLPWGSEEMKQKGTVKTRLGQEPVRGIPLQLEATPVTTPDAGKRSNIKEGIADRKHVKATVKNTDQETVSIKPAEPTVEKKTPENNDDKIKHSPEKDVNGRDEKVPSHSSQRSKSSSPTKSSKLPPICLRVDPLRKKKNNNGGSRSPSPPGDKEKLLKRNDQLSNPVTAKGIPEQHVTVREIAPERIINLEQNKKKVKTIEVVDGASKQERQEPTQNLNISDLQDSNSSVNTYGAESVWGTNVKSEEMVFPDTAANQENLKSAAKYDPGEGKSIEHKHWTDEDKGNSGPPEGAIQETKKYAKISLSEAEAALVIQSAYRGYEVRRWEPLKKLRQIANIREEVVSLSDRIKDLESCSDTRENDKCRTMIGESIMTLLKLDTIQALHPSVRDVRKSVVRELVSLQEKLDSLSLERSESAYKQSCSGISDNSMQLTVNVSCQGGGEVEKALLGREDVHEVCHEEVCQGVAPTAADNASDSSGLGILKMVMNQEDSSGGAHEPVSYLFSVNTTQTSETGCLLDNETGEDLMNSALDDGQGLSAEFQTQPPSEEMKHPEIQGAAFMMDKNRNLNQSAGVVKEVVESNLQDGNLLLCEAKDDKALRGEKAIEDNFPVKELQGDVCDDDIEDVREHVIIERGDDKFVEDKTRNSNAVGEFFNMDIERGEPVPEPMVQNLVSPESNGTLACQINVEGNRKLLRKGDSKLQEIDESFVSKQADICEMRAKVVQEMHGEVVARQESEKHKCSTEIEEKDLSAPTEPSEVSDAKEVVLRKFASLETENGSASRRETGIAAELEDPSSCKDAVTLEGDGPIVFTKSAGVEAGQKLQDETIDAEASGLATGDSNITAECCDSATTMGEDIVDQTTVPLGEKKIVVVELPPSSQIPSPQNNDSTEHERKRVEEKEKLREMMQKLIEAGQEQLSAISNVSARVRDLEKKLSRRKNKLKLRRHGTSTARYVAGMSC